MATLSSCVRKSGLEESLIQLIDIRVSQINGCGYCLDMHTKDARAIGETEQRIYLLSTWREAPLYTARERAALAWAEALTEVCKTRDVPDEVYNDAREHFSESELVDLSLAIVAINGYNRLNVGFRTVPGTYVPKNRKSV